MAARSPTPFGADWSPVWPAREPSPRILPPRAPPQVAERVRLNKKETGPGEWSPHGSVGCRRKGGLRRWMRTCMARRR